MAGLIVVPRAQAPQTGDYPSASCEAVSAPQVHTLSPPGTSLWLHEATFPSDATLTWRSPHGDEGLYVLAGEVTVCGPAADQRRVPAHGGVVVEAGAASIVLVAAGTTLLHMGPVDPLPPQDGPFGPPLPGDGEVHAVGPGGLYARLEPGRETRFIADSSCQTCRITLMLTGREDRYVSPAHSHSQDELIHVLSGSITVGRDLLGPGDTLFVAADRRYTFTSSEGFSFLNYRRDASWHTLVRGGEPMLEGGKAHGFDYVADLVQPA